MGAKWAFASVCAFLAGLRENRRPLSSDVPSGGSLGPTPSICTAALGRFTVLEVLLLALTLSDEPKGSFIPSGEGGI